MMGVSASPQRYSLVLYGTTQRLKLEPWEPETRTFSDQAVHMEARHVVPLETASREPANGAVRARGKAWPTGEQSRPNGY